MDDPINLSFSVDGRLVTVPDDGSTLLDVLRGQLGVTSAKDGCSPQGQCGCCTVLVDGQARVSCVTPTRRVTGRSVTTLEGLGADEIRAWADAFCAVGGSQCGFCTPGIIVRLSALRVGALPDNPPNRDRAARALNAHLCRCTGWQTILDAWDAYGTDYQVLDSDKAAARATIEGRTSQIVGPDVALGGGGFAADTAPDGCLIAVPDRHGGWVVADTLPAAQAAANKVQGRRTTFEVRPPLEAPPGSWDAVLRTPWVEPAYLETDASWCEPGGRPASPLANGGAFGAKISSVASDTARHLADEYQQPVLVLLSREDTVRTGPKRPPVAGGATSDGHGVLRVARTTGIAQAVAAVAPDLVVEEIDIPGPPTSADIRAAGWAEALVLLAGARGTNQPITSPDGAVASAQVDDGRIEVTVRCGDPLDEVVLRSYCVGAAHMAWSWVTSEALAVDTDGTPLDLTVRSFGVVRATDTPRIDVNIDPDDRAPTNGSDAVFAAVAAATWLHRGAPADLPTGP
ncbi:MAG: 2Fe-2S iron-sulfur cluster-binding protein [Actinomycetota bacterium]|nr:2Fe-2S iron-sulfur cluster-binding protein [Actinomycetota bacterium]